jgi:hypothetical protein
MTETIANTNAAASTLFLGHDGEWWDFWLVASVIIAALAAIAIGVATTGSIVSHKREAASADEALELFKLEMGKKTSEATADAARANESSELLRKETARLSADAEASRAAIADANARAFEAKLALEQFKADRSLTEEQRARIVEKLKQFAGQSYILSGSADQEAIRFMRVLAPIFRDAGWQQLPSPSPITFPDTNAGMNVAPEPGVRIQIAPSKVGDEYFMKLVVAVADAIASEGIAAEPRQAEELEATPNAIQIRVGSKPK